MPSPYSNDYFNTCLIKNCLGLLHGVMTWAGLDLSDRQHHFNNSWFSMNIVAILGILKI